MANAIQQAGGAAEPSSFAPLHTNRIFTGLWTNRSPLSDAAVSSDMEKYGLGRQDSIYAGLNTEISSKLTLIRRPGTNVYNAQIFPPINRFYPFNTFTLTTEKVVVLADTAATVYDATGLNPDFTPLNRKVAIWQKSAGAGPTFFLGVGNTLFFTNGVDNKQWAYNPTTGTGPIFDWGITAPVTAPVATQQPRPNPYPNWASQVAQAAYVTNNGVLVYNKLVILSGSSRIQEASADGYLGLAEPTTWGQNPGDLTTDGSVTWTCRGQYVWQGNHPYPVGSITVGFPPVPGVGGQFFVAIQAGTSTNAPAFPSAWPAGLGQQVSDGTTGLIWQNIGRALAWSDVGIVNQQIPVHIEATILDPNGNLETVFQQGRTNNTAPTIWPMEKFALTTDNTVIWQQTGPFAVQGNAPIQYGYAFKNSVTGDISNMSPRSNSLLVIQGNEVQIQGDGSTQSGVDTIILYRIAQGGSTFLYLAEFPNPPSGQKWTYIDNIPDSGLNETIQAQVGGEGTPLPSGATCLAYHLQRIFAAVGNVVYVSSGPDAIASTSSGNAGFDTTFTAQSKITRFWVSPLGLIVFTVRDSYIILGSATDSDPLYMTTFVDRLPLLHYDAFTTHLTTPYMMLGYQMVVALDPSAGITEISFPIADRIEAEMNPATAFVTYHAQASREAALYVSDGATEWYRMSATTAPETGLSWSPRAILEAPISAVQSVEILPGIDRLLIGPGPQTGPILFRDINARSDNGNPYPAWTTFGSIVLAHPGELAALAFFTLESKKIGTKPSLSVLLGEVSGTFETLNRTRQDPTNLPPSNTLFSDRYHFLQSQSPAWCRHFQMTISWPEEDAANELYTYTIFGQTWQEYRSQ